MLKKFFLILIIIALTPSFLKALNFNETKEKLFYSFEIAKEKWQIFLTRDEKKQIKLYLNFLQNRLLEYKTFKEQGKEKLAERALTLYINQLEQMVKKISKNEKPFSDEEIQKLIEEKLEMLHSFYALTPPPAKSKLEKALHITENVSELIKETFTGKKREVIQKETKKFEIKLKDLIKKLWPI
jgi:uncharacterized protein YdcH (DUF465 family)